MSGTRRDGTAVAATGGGLSADAAARQRRMALLARAGGDELAAAWNGLAEKPGVEMLRGPEVGLVMLRGRIGGTGGAFNVGEAAVSRATVRLSTGEVGHGMLLGSDRERARLAAVFDALALRADTADAVARLVAAVQVRLAAEDERRDAETAATRVDFFTLVRGEDE